MICMLFQVSSGIGLSSSAACEVLLGTAGNHLFCGDAYDAVTIARIGQKAENIYFWKTKWINGSDRFLSGHTGGDYFENRAPVVRPIEANLEGLGAGTVHH